jgi:HSP20 family protein
MTMLLDPLAPWLEPNRRSTTGRSAPPTFKPPTDLMIGESDVKVVMDVPGMSVEDLEIELADGALAIRGERRYDYRDHEDSRALSRLERGFGRFERILRLPKEVDAAAIEAAIESGILTLTIPLPAVRKPQRVEIRSVTEPAAVDAEVEDAGDDRRRELTGAASNPS